MTEFEQKLFMAVAKTIKDDNANLQALKDKVMAEVRAYCDKHKKAYKALNDFQKERLNDAGFVISHVTRFKYTEQQLDRAIDSNLKRVPGNLADEDKRKDLYNVLANLNFKCIYSDTLLVGGGQSIHLDHIIPVNLGGPTDDWNILPICGSCNSSKSDSHLLDWWEKEHTPQDEHKLVYIFEYMANRLLKSLNTKGVKVVTTLTDEQIRTAIELENKERQQEESKQQTIDLEEYDIEDDYQDIEDTEEVKDQKIKRLDAITFLYQMLNHIKQNKHYIISSDNLNQGMLDTLSEKDIQRLIDKKFKKLEKLFNSVYKQNKRLTGVKTDVQLLDEQRKMVEYIKSLYIVSYYHISYTYFDELQQMLNDGKTDKEIQDFCYDHDRSFNVDIFIQQLQDFMATHDGRYPRQSNTKDEFERTLGVKVAMIRYAKKGKGEWKLTNEVIEKLEEIDFIWDAKILIDIDEFINKLQVFIKENGRYPMRGKDYNKERELANQVHSIRMTYRKIQNNEKTERRLTKEMIKKLNGIGFIWEVTKESRYADWFTPFCEELQQFIKEKGRYPRASKEEEKSLAYKVSRIRQLYVKTQNNQNTKKRLTREMIDKLNEMNFAWSAEDQPEVEPEWFTHFYENLKNFIIENGRYPTDSKKANEEEKKLISKIDHIRQAKKGKGNIRLTQEMIDKLDEIYFAWTAKEQKEKIALFLAEQGIGQGLTA